MDSVFNENNIILNGSFLNKNEAIVAVGKILVKQGYVTEKYIDAMLAREKIVSVYIGNNVAIPHGINGSQSEIVNSGISLIQVPAGVSFGENETAYIVIGIAGKGDEHMEYLQKIALVCSEIENVMKIKNATTKQEILEIFEEWYKLIFDLE